jgi:hypothetical protein
MREECYTTFVPSKHGFHFRNGLPIVPKFLRGLLNPKWGVCGGMCWSALDRYFAGEPIPDTKETPLPGSPLYKELFWRQVDTTSSWRWLKTIVWQNRFNKTMARLTREQEWPKAKESIDKGIPITLCIIRVPPIVGIPTANHQVLAVGYRTEPVAASKPMHLSIYDPNRPDQDTAMLYMTGEGPNDSWKTHIPDTSDAKRFRGFFVIPHESK